MNSFPLPLILEQEFPHLRKTILKIMYWVNKEIREFIYINFKEKIFKWLNF